MEQQNGALCVFARQERGMQELSVIAHHVQFPVLVLLHPIG